MRALIAQQSNVGSIAFPRGGFADSEEYVHVFTRWYQSRLRNDLHTEAVLSREETP